MYLKIHKVDRAGSEKESSHAVMAIAGVYIVYESAETTLVASHFRKGH